MIEFAMVSITEGFTDNSSMSPRKYVPVKQPSVRKLLRQFTEILDVKLKTILRWLCADKSKYKVIRGVSMLLSSIPERFIHTKINECF